MKLSVSMWSVVYVVKAGKMDLPGFVEFAARQQVNGAQRCRTVGLLLA